MEIWTPWRRSARARGRCDERRIQQDRRPFLPVRAQLRPLSHAAPGLRCRQAHPACAPPPVRRGPRRRRRARRRAVPYTHKAARSDFRTGQLPCRISGQRREGPLSSRRRRPRGSTARPYRRTRPSPGTGPQRRSRCRVLPGEAGNSPSPPAAPQRPPRPRIPAWRS